MPKQFHLFVCHSAQPKVRGGGNCAEKGSAHLYHHLSALIAQYELEKRVSLLPSACLSNCQQGISLRVLPDMVLYGQLTPEDLEEIIQSHLIEGQPVARLQVKRSTSLLDL